MKYNCIMGIDPGKTGAISVLTNKMKVPVSHTPENFDELKQVLRLYNDFDVIVFLEKVNIWFKDDTDNPGKKFRIQKLIDSYVELRTAIKMTGYDVVEVTPVQWLKGIGLPNIKDRTERKNRNKTHAKYFYPGLNITHANADSLLILQYGISKLSGGQIIPPAPKPKPEQGKLF